LTWDFLADCQWTFCPVFGPRADKCGQGQAVTPPPYPEPVVQLAHYAEAFYLTTEQCFRLIHAEDGTRHAQHCPYITEWRARFQDRAGKWNTVVSCNGRRADLDSVQRIRQLTR
jgi:hypothetical protein